MLTIADFSFCAVHVLAALLVLVVVIVVGVLVVLLVVLVPVVGAALDVTRLHLEVGHPVRDDRGQLVVVPGLVATLAADGITEGIVAHVGRGRERGGGTVAAVSDSRAAVRPAVLLPEGVAGVGLHLLLVDLLHVLVVVLLLQLPDEDCLLVRVGGELLLGVGAELREGLLVERVLDLSPLVLLSLTFQLRQSFRLEVGFLLIAQGQSRPLLFLAVGRERTP